jgi:CheY-like chemotaxis protein
MDFAFQPFKILAVDDSAVSRKLIEHSLSGERYSVLFAKDGQFALVTDDDFLVLYHRARLAKQNIAAIVMLFEHPTVTLSFFLAQPKAAILGEL